VRTATAAVGSARFFVVALGVVPWWLTGWQMRDWPVFSIPLRLVGMALVAAGAALLVGGFVRFVGEGAGTHPPNPSQTQPLPVATVLGWLDPRCMAFPANLPVLWRRSGQACGTEESA